MKLHLIRYEHIFKKKRYRSRATLLSFHDFVPRGHCFPSPPPTFLRATFPLDTRMG